MRGADHQECRQDQDWRQADRQVRAACGRCPPRRLERRSIAATQEIKRLRKGASKNAWAIGRRLAQVAQLGLHRSRGYASIDEYAAKELELLRDTAFLYMRVAHAFSETTATFGIEKLDRALRYIAATPENEKPPDIPELKFRVPSEDGEGVVNKSFEEVTITDLRRAVVRERASVKPGSRKKSAAPSGSAQVARREQARRSKKRRRRMTVPRS